MQQLKYLAAVMRITNSLTLGYPTALCLFWGSPVT
jgi:hypothetical protein